MFCTLCGSTHSHSSCQMASKSCSSSVPFFFSTRCPAPPTPPFPLPLLFPQTTLLAAAPPRPWWRLRNTSKRSLFFKTEGRAEKRNGLFQEVTRKESTKQKKQKVTTNSLSLSHNGAGLCLRSSFPTSRLRREWSGRGILAVHCGGEVVLRPLYHFPHQRATDRHANTHTSVVDSLPMSFFIFL